MARYSGRLLSNIPCSLHESFKWPFDLFFIEMRIPSVRLFESVFQVLEHSWLGYDRYLDHADVEGERGVHALNHGGEGGGYAKLLPQNSSRARQKVIQGMGRKFYPCFIRRIIFRYFLDDHINVTDTNAAFLFKVKNQAEEFSFKPAEVVKQICTIYTHLAESEAFLKAVSTEGRSYSHDLFAQVNCKYPLSYSV